MSSPRAILLVPATGDPHGLLAPGVCGARVPMAVRLGPPPAPWVDLSPEDSRDMTDWEWGMALVLAWEGVAVDAGRQHADAHYLARAVALLDTDGDATTLRAEVP